MTSYAKLMIIESSVTAFTLGGKAYKGDPMNGVPIVRLSPKNPSTKRCKKNKKNKR